MKVKMHEALGLAPDAFAHQGPSMFDVVVFEPNEAFLRARAREMRDAQIEAGSIAPPASLWREWLLEGLSFSMHEAYFSVGVYARKRPGEP